jgi:hypothetical protein
LLELGLALGLVVVSAAFLFGIVAAAVYMLGPLTSSGGSRGGGMMVVGALGFGIALLRYPWAALLRYYRYEAHTLRPLKDNETTTPGNGHEKNEG